MLANVSIDKRLSRLCLGVCIVMSGIQPPVHGPDGVEVIIGKTQVTMRPRTDSERPERVLK
jgi:hypothetical protein